MKNILNLGWLLGCCLLVGTIFGQENLILRNDTAIVRNDYNLAVAMAKTGKKVFLAFLDSKELQLPEQMDKALAKQLIGFYCDNCHLAAMPKGFEKCSQLINLEVNWYMFDDAPDNSELLEQIAKLKQLQELTIHGFKLNPKLNWAATNLERLQLTACKLTTVPKWIYEQKKLKALRLGCNEIKVVGEAIGGLTQLETLMFDGGACGGNPIEKLPIELNKLKELQYFDISYSKLKNFPMQLFELPNLEVMGLHYPGIETFEDAIPAHKSLKSFKFNAGDEFQGFPKSFANLSLDKLRVDVYLPSCAAIKTKSILTSMEENIAEYEVSFRGVDFPGEAEENWEMLGPWECAEEMQLLPELDAPTGKYFILKSNKAYLSSFVDDEYGASMDVVFKELMYSNNCLSGTIFSSVAVVFGSKYKGYTAQFDMSYDKTQEQLTLKNSEGKVYTLKRRKK